MSISQPTTPFYYKYVCKIAAIFHGGGLGGHLWSYPKDENPYCERCGEIWQITNKVKLDSKKPKSESFEETRPICLGCWSILDFDEICDCSGRIDIVSDEDKSDDNLPVSSDRLSIVDPDTDEGPIDGVIFEVDEDYKIEVKARDGIYEDSLLVAIEEELKAQGYDVRRLKR